jgi:alpha-D-xyloside xylohydrolase
MFSPGRYSLRCGFRATPGLFRRNHKTGASFMFSTCFSPRGYAFRIAILLTLIAWNRPSGAQEFERMANGVLVHSTPAAVRVEVCSERVIHVVAGETDNKPALVPAVIRPCSGAAFSISSDKGSVQIHTSALQVTIDRKTGSVRFLSADGASILSEAPDHTRLLPGQGKEGGAQGVEQYFALSPEEALYGLGQHQEGFFNLRDIPIRLLQANTNIAVPFLVSTKGYGLLWNNASLTDFNPTTKTIQLDKTGKGTFQSGPEGVYGFLLSGNLRDRLRLSIDDTKVIDIDNMWVPSSAGAKTKLDANRSYRIQADTGGETTLLVRMPADGMGFHSDAGQGVDYYFMYGPQPSRVVAEYREFTGVAPLLPRWAYGFWQCRERYASQQQILDTAAEFRRRKIPVDVFVQDWQYWGKYGWNAMKFDESAYPDPAAMMSEIHRQDLHLVISVWAKFGAETEVNREMQRAHLLLTSNASTAEPGEANERENWADLFNPATQKEFWSQIDHGLFRLGLDGWWLDASEPEGDPLKNDVTFLGPGKTVRNAFPLFETSAVYNGQRTATEDKRVVILSRSAYTGQQRNGSISWSGDVSANWETLRRQIPAGLSFGVSGFPYWTTDIGGFFRPADQYTSAAYHELLIRWFEYGAFCPIFRIHGYRSETEMWKYGPEVERILTQYDQLRYRLLPYIYSSAWGVTNRGEVLMKALPFAFPNDLSVRDIGDQFLFGGALLVNPVTQPDARKRTLVLPAGENWVDFWTGEKHSGGQTISVDAPLDRMPIMVKEGSIVPMGPIVQSAAEAADPLEIRVYSGKDADFELYEDRGDGYAYEHGAHSTIHLHWNDRLHELTIADREGKFPEMRASRSIQIVLVGSGRGVGLSTDSQTGRIVTYDGRKITVQVRPH